MFLLPTFNIINAQIFIHIQIMNILAVATVSLQLSLCALAHRASVKVFHDGVEDCFEKCSEKCAQEYSRSLHDPLESRRRIKREAKRPTVTQINDGVEDCFEKCAHKCAQEYLGSLYDPLESRRRIDRKAKGHGNELTV